MSVKLTTTKLINIQSNNKPIISKARKGYNLNNRTSPNLLRLMQWLKA